MSGRQEYVVSFPRLDGGLNTWELAYRLDANESPDMVNLWWRDGALCSRDGQVYASGEELGHGWSVCEQPYHDHLFFHIGEKIYRAAAAPSGWDGGMQLKEFLSGIPENRGTWFRYGDSLYYKNRGGYFKIGCDEQGDLVCAAVEAYTPVILINADPQTGAGDEYQGENRLSGQKTVWYSTVEGVTVYRLPVQDVDSVDKVIVDGETLVDGKEYTADLAAGTVTFAAQPQYHEPVQVNTVHITYTKQNQAAYQSIMDCPYAAVYGGDQNVCVVLGGGDAQPNAYFWCGNHAVMDPGYFPFEQYNLAGDAQDAITGFGKQQNMLVIFKERSVGKTALGTQEMASGRVLLTMHYTAINSAVGCDLPWSIQLVENNLVFANRRSGVWIVRDTSAAYENNITPISRKIDNGLVPLLSMRSDVCSCDDGERYWIVSNGTVYLWDYALSGASDPVWFCFTGIHAASFFRVGSVLGHLDGRGRVTAMLRNFSDYGNAIVKRYRFATQSMGGYDRLKEITGVIFTLKSDADTVINISYETDYEKRADLTPVRTGSWKLAPRRLALRDLSFRRFANVARRKPGCRRVRHFTMELTNQTAGTDMAVVSAQMFYRYQGRDR